MCSSPSKDKDKVAICKPRKKNSPEHAYVISLISYSQSTELSKNKFPLFKQLSLWYYVMEVQTDSAVADY